jgi:hypothetical protein
MSTKRVEETVEIVMRNGEDDEKRLRRMDGEEIVGICSCNGSLLSLSSSSGTIKLTAISHSSKGGLSVDGEEVVIEEGKFEENNPSIEGYPSFRRNILCSSGELNVKSLKGGDGIQNGTSLWILNSSGCVLKGISEDRSSSFFIPTLSNVNNEDDNSDEVISPMVSVSLIGVKEVKGIGVEGDEEEEDSGMREKER